MKRSILQEDLVKTIKASEAVEKSPTLVASPFNTGLCYDVDSILNDLREKKINSIKSNFPRKAIESLVAGTGFKYDEDHLKACEENVNLEKVLLLSYKEDIDPVVVIDNGGQGLFLLDGTHRCCSRLILGSVDIECQKIMATDLIPYLK